MLKFFNTYINIKNASELKKVFNDALDKKRKVFFYYLNSYSFYLTGKSSLFREAFNSADYILPDGMSIVFALKLLTDYAVRKVSPNHFLPQMIFGKRRLKIYLLGAEDDVLSGVQLNLETDYEGMKICGYHNGYFDESESLKIIERINSSYPDLLLVGMGMPKSELWIYKHRNLFGDFPIMTVGNYFDILGKKVKASPKFLYNSGFEWIFRMIQEPRKLFPRYIKAHSYFIYKILKNKL